ncbi:SRPBCC family protein [Hydrocarboniphaga sp.]|uniref:SRPBCC family protein n=1 Tax=Hydrocarboniphaga sp. TaxID=2033016 RepID=UPI003D0C5DF8
MSDEVDAPADAIWEMLLNWPAILEWMRVEGRPVPLVDVQLKAGHTLGQLPCTRNCIFDTALLPPGIVIPAMVPETLLYVDHVARFIYYNMEGEGPFGLRNYLATTEVDDLGNGRSRVTCSGRFDLPSAAPTAVVKGAIEAVYDCIVHDIAATATKRFVA